MIKILQKLNLFTKSLVLNKSTLTNKQRRTIIKGLVDLGYIKHKVPISECIEILYRIKKRIVVAAKKTCKSRQVTIQINEDRVFDRVTLKEDGIKKTFHIPKDTKKPIRRNSIKQKCIHTTDKPQMKGIRQVKETAVFTTHKYKPGDLLEHLTITNIQYVFNGINQVLKRKTNENKSREAGETKPKPS